MPLLNEGEKEGSENNYFLKLIRFQSGLYSSSNPDKNTTEERVKKEDLIPTVQRPSN